MYRMHGIAKICAFTQDFCFDQQVGVTLKQTHQDYQGFGGNTSPRS